MTPILPSEWRKVKQHVDEQISNCLCVLEGRVDEEETAYQRGRIAALRSIITWGEEESADTSLIQIPSLEY